MRNLPGLSKSHSLSFGSSAVFDASCYVTGSTTGNFIVFLAAATFEAGTSLSDSYLLPSRLLTAREGTAPPLKSQFTEAFCTRVFKHHISDILDTRFMMSDGRRFVCCRIVHSFFKNFKLFFIVCVRRKEMGAGATAKALLCQCLRRFILHWSNVKAKDIQRLILFFLAIF